VFSASTYLHSAWVTPLILGTIFGASGFLYDYVTRARHQISAWAMVAGGALLGLAWLQSRAGLSFQIPIWIVGMQYTGVVWVWWGVLMFLPPRNG
jgi:hypothetical protein